MEKTRNVIAELDELGIIGIKTAGVLTPELIENAIDNTKELFSRIDMDDIVARVNSVRE